MNRFASLVIGGLVLILGVTLSWGGPPNPTPSDGNANTAGGTNALVDVTSGFGNTAFGSIALFSNTTGDFNTASGADALRNNTTGSLNTASGADALRNNTTGSLNTASGFDALGNNTTGDFNTASGADALTSNTTGSNNTASGFAALLNNTTGDFNTASGASALEQNTTGDANTASGGGALENNTTGARNTALGSQALQNSTGNQNIAVGQGAGVALTSGNKNIYLGHPGASSESRTMRLGNVQTQTFMAGVATTALPGGVPVLIKANGKLGTQLSSARYKRDIETMGARSAGVLKLRPVTFAYTEDEEGVRQYGLLAEEVAAVYPELVTRTAAGDVQAVRYQELIPMLVNEVQRQRETMEQQQQATERLQRELVELRSLVGQQRGFVAER